jgi:hypothetical protein
MRGAMGRALPVLSRLQPVPPVWGGTAKRGCIIGSIHSARSSSRRQVGQWLLLRAGRLQPTAAPQPEAPRPLAQGPGQHGTHLLRSILLMKMMAMVRGTRWRATLRSRACSMSCGSAMGAAAPVTFDAVGPAADAAAPLVPSARLLLALRQERGGGALHDRVPPGRRAHRQACAQARERWARQARPSQPTTPWLAQSPGWPLTFHPFLPNRSATSATAWTEEKVRAVFRGRVKQVINCF